IGITFIISHGRRLNATTPRLALDEHWTGTLAPGKELARSLPALQVGHTYVLRAALRSGTLREVDRLSVSLVQNGKALLSKDLHAGDPDLYTHYRPATTDPVVLRLAAGPSGSMQLPFAASFSELPVAEADRPAFDPGPNDVRRAAPLVLGRTVYG